MVKKRADKALLLNNAQRDAGGAHSPSDAAQGAGIEADRLAFRAAVQGVRPLAHTPSGLAPPAAGPRKRRVAARASAVIDIEAEMPIVGAHVTPEQQLAFHRSGVRDQVLRRLRRGLVPVEGELDLHGLNQARARVLLADFLDASKAQGARCVRVIHGKGMRSGERGAVLKSAVDHWLRRHYDVLAFTSAKAIDGGTGALYVLLRA
jgi:DNA-nicking Smr family endonuclease